jgi:hypothetical protein
MAYVEEVIPKEPLQIPLESLLFTVPENWQPPSNFSAEATAPATRGSPLHQHHGGGRGGSHLYRGGGIPEEFLHLDSQDALLPGDNEFSNAAAEDEELGKEDGTQGWHTRMVQGWRT